MGYVICMEVTINSYTLAAKPEAMGSLGRPRRKWKYNIKKDPAEVGWKGVEWIHTAHGPVTVGSCEHGNEISGFMKVRKYLSS
jgi:hypothetical protein